MRQVQTTGLILVKFGMDLDYIGFFIEKIILFPWDEQRLLRIKGVAARCTDSILNEYSVMQQLFKHCILNAIDRYKYILAVNFVLEKLSIHT